MHGGRTGTAGATSVKIEGAPCEFPEEAEASVSIPVDETGKTCPVTVTNTFEEAKGGPQGPAGPPVPPGEAAAAPAVVARARFTG